MEAGEEPPPYINHDEIDWTSLVGSFRSAFEHALQRVTLRLADDTVDLTVIQRRLQGFDPGPIDCKDFGELLLVGSVNTRKSLIPIRSAWEPLQFIRDRSQAPPPVLIPLVISGPGTEVGICLHSMRLLLGVRAAHDMMAAIATPPEELPDDFHQGHLPTGLLNTLEQAFGLPYESLCTLTPIVDIDPAKLIYG